MNLKIENARVELAESQNYVKNLEETLAKARILAKEDPKNEERVQKLEETLKKEKEDAESKAAEIERVKNAIAQKIDDAKEQIS